MSIILTSLSGCGCVPRRDAVPANGVLGGHVCNSTGKDDPRIQVQVVDSITILVVVDVVWHAGTSAEHLEFLLGFDTLGSTGDAT